MGLTNDDEEGAIESRLYSSTDILLSCKMDDEIFVCCKSSDKRSKICISSPVSNASFERWIRVVVSVDSDDGREEIVLGSIEITASGTGSASVDEG